MKSTTNGEMATRKSSGSAMASLASRAGVGFRKARPRLLVEEHELTAFAVQVAGTAEVEQGRDGFRADAALLHAGAGVMGEGLHATTPGLRPPAGPGGRRWCRAGRGFPGRCPAGRRRRRGGRRSCG